MKIGKKKVKHSRLVRAEWTNEEAGCRHVRVAGAKITQNIKTGESKSKRQTKPSEEKKSATGEPEEKVKQQT